MRKSKRWPGTWSVHCMVCGCRRQSDQILKRWDGVLVCKEDYEERHPQTLLPGNVARTSEPPPFIHKDPYE